MPQQERVSMARTSDINDLLWMSNRLPYVVSNLRNVQDNLRAVMKIFDDFKDVHREAQEQEVPAFITPATMCNVSRGLLTLASSAIWLQAKIAHNAQDDLRNITHDHKGILRTLGICLKQFEDREEILIGLSEDAAIPVALPEPFLNAISDEYEPPVRTYTPRAQLASKVAARGGSSRRGKSTSCGRSSSAIATPRVVTSRVPRTYIPSTASVDYSFPPPSTYRLLPRSQIANASASHNAPASHTTTASQNASGSETEPETDAEVADTTSTAFKHDTPGSRACNASSTRVARASHAASGSETEPETDAEFADTTPTAFKRNTPGSRDRNASNPRVTSASHNVSGSDTEPETSSVTEPQTDDEVEDIKIPYKRKFLVSPEASGSRGTSRGRAASGFHSASGSETEPQTDDEVGETVEAPFKRKRFESIEWNGDAAADWDAKLADLPDYF